MPQSKSDDQPQERTWELDDGSYVTTRSRPLPDDGRRIERVVGADKVVLSPGALGVGRMQRLTDGEPFDLVIDLCGFFARYLVVTEDQLLALALWTLHTYIYDRYPQSPLLAVTAPESDSGKSRVLDTQERVCARPLKGSNMSVAVLFRTIEKDHPTVLLDEGDAIFEGKKEDYKELRSLIDDGARRGGKVGRSTAKGDALWFDVYCPKAIAAIGVLPETVANRAVPIQMVKDDAGVFEPYRERRAEELAAPLRERIQAWADQAELAEEPTPPKELDGRRADIVEPLLAVADDLGWGRAARAALVRLLTAPRVDSEPAQSHLLLEDLKAWFDEHPEQDFAPSAQLRHHLNGLEESAWKKMNHNQGIDGSDIARLLRPYRVSSDRHRVTPGRTGKQARGYFRATLEPVWRRHKIQ